MTEIRRTCLREPVVEIGEAASYLEEAVNEHLAGNFAVASGLIQRADIPAIREWTESLWGGRSPYVKVRAIPDAPPFLDKEQRIRVRMPNAAEKRILHERDGYHCRFCGIPLIRMEVRKRVSQSYPEALPWGSTNQSQHAAFQAMWLQYDHLLPHSRGGTNDVENVVLTCAPCNYGRWHYTVDEVGLCDPRQRQPFRSGWDGLERFR